MTPKLRRCAQPATRPDFLVLITLSILLLPNCVAAQQVWSGRDYYFEKEDYADWTLAENQDRITDEVWITRKDNGGIFNIAQESGYQVFHSPQDTEWATGDAVDWPNLTFQTWQDWNNSYPPDMVGEDAVVHLISNDIYIDIRFESWTVAAQGGGFSYYRAAEPPSASEPSTWGMIKKLYE